MKELKRILRRKGFRLRKKEPHMVIDYDHMSNPFSNKFWERYNRRMRNKAAYAAFMESLRY